MKRPLRLGEGMRDEQGWHATDCQPIVSRRSIRVRQIHKRVKTLGIVVGATGFEPATPCAQGRCATRLRYAPTLKTLDSTALLGRVLVRTLRLPSETQASPSVGVDTLLLLVIHEASHRGPTPLVDVHHDERPEPAIG
jgi:hypothetical protein